MPGRRVVYVDHVARLSGGELALAALLEELGDRVEAVVVLGEDGPLRPRLERAGVRVVVRPLDPGLRDTRRAAGARALAHPRLLWHLVQAVQDLRRLLVAERAEVVHTNSLKAALYGGLAARLAGVPVVWHVRDRLAADYLPMTLLHLVRTAALVLPHAVIANSATTFATLPSRPRLRRVVHNGVRLPVVVSDVSDLRVVGMVGRLAPWKGQDLFLRAFATAFRGTDVRARVIGGALFGEHAFVAVLRELAVDLGIGGQVDFTGFAEDVSAQLLEIDVLVHASTVAEPFGQVVLQGMAAGLPVVSTDAGGPTEVVTHGCDGLLVPLGDERALADALLLLRDPVRRTALGTAARRRAADFSPARSAGGVLEAYEDLLGA